MESKRKVELRRKVKNWRSKQIPETRYMYIPEPVHRVSSISKGMSYRKLPDPTFEEIRKTCLFYLRKGGGSVNPKSKIHRYLYELSTEIIALSRHLQKFYGEKMKRMRRSIGRYKTICKEWQDIFGSDFSDNEFTPGEDFATPKTLYEELVGHRKITKKLQKELQISKERERKANEKYQQVIHRHHDSSRKAMEKNYFSLNEKLEKIMTQHKHEFLETVKEKNDFIQSLTEEVASYVSTKNNQDEQHEKIKDELEKKELEIIRQKKVILRLQQREILRNQGGNTEDLSTIERLSTGTMSTNRMGRPSESGLGGFLSTQEIRREEEEEEEGENQVGSSQVRNNNNNNNNQRQARVMSEEELVEMLDKNEVMNVLNLYKRKVLILTKENERFRAILQKMNAAKYMDDFYSIKQRVSEMFGKNLDRISPQKKKIKKKKRNISSSSNIHMKKKKKKKIPEETDSSEIAINNSKNWNGVLDRLDRSAFETSQILERMKRNKND